MPTKRNKAGEQQNYVPAGNGDASGEYGDSATGSNKHFTAFKKPDEQEVKVEEQNQVTETPKEEVTETQEQQPPVEEQAQEEKKETRLKELSKKQIKEIGNYVIGRYNPERIGRLLETLRYYTGSFGDLSSFSDEELKDIVEQLANAEKSQDMVWVKDGKNWKGTKNKGIFELAGIKTYTKDERDELIRDQNRELVEKSQSEGDKKIQSIFKKSVVCFGKGYSKEDIQEIEKASQNLVNDFPELADYVKEIGDRNNLEKYINAMNSRKEFSEEEIQAEMKKIKSMYFFGTPKEDKLREDAIKNLQGGTVKIQNYKNTYAYWSPVHKRMIFLGRMKDAKDSLQNDFSLNYHPTADVIGVYYHEMGHSIDSMIQGMYKNLERSIDRLDYNKTSNLYNLAREYRQKFNELRDQNFNKEYQSAFDNAFKEKYGVMPDDMNAYKILSEKGVSLGSAKYDLKKELIKNGVKPYNVSEYAKTNDAEFLAECFSAHYCNANNPICEELFNTAMDYYKKLKEFKL